MPGKYSRLQEQEVVVTFDRDHPVYHPGETVTGTVACNIPHRRDNVRGVVLKIRAKGVVTIHKTEAGGPGGNPQTLTYRAKHYFVKEDVVLFDAEAAAGGVLESGRLELPFRFPLPSDCPPSLAYGAELGKIVYYVRAKIDAPVPLHKKLNPIHKGRNKIKYSHYGMFAVTMPAVSEPLAGEPVVAHKQVKAGGLMGLVGGKPINCTAKLEAGTALQFGGTAQVSVAVDNASSGKVDGIRASLVHELYFTASRFEERVPVVIAKSAKICCKKTDGEPVGKNSQAERVLTLRLPQSLPYTHPDIHTGRLQPLPHRTRARLEKEKPLGYAWPYSHPPSRSADPTDIWLVKENLSSRYYLKVHFKVKRGSDAVIRIPVTVHRGLPSASDLEQLDAADGSDDNISVHSLGEKRA